MVFKMIEKQYSSLMKGPPYHYHPEILTVQYILPCFVASYLEMENTDESNKAKEEYLRFVHELVKSYEQHAYCLELPKLEQKQPYYIKVPCFLPNLFIDTVENYEKSCKVIGDMASFCSEYVLKGLGQIFIFNIVPKPCKCYRKPDEPSDSWFYQQHMIFHRIFITLDKLGKMPSASVCYSVALSVVFNNITAGRVPKLDWLNLVLMHRIGPKVYGKCSAHAETTQEELSLYKEFEGLSAGAAIWGVKGGV
jgi:hypothetical protein